MLLGRSSRERLFFAGTMVAVALLSWLFYADLETWFPSHIHAWTQSDRLALAYGFLDNGFNLFLPTTFNVFTVDGVTGVDFPIHEYIVAIIMKVADSRDPIIFRLYTLLWMCVGYGALFFSVNRYTGTVWKGALAVLFTFSLPIVTYYQFGFIPSATSFGSFLIALSCYLGFLSSGKNKMFAWTLFFVGLAALPRMSCNILVIGFISLAFLRWYKMKQIDRQQAMAIVVAVVVIAISLMYKAYLNNAYGSRFLTVLMPADTGYELSFILSEMWIRWRLQFASLYHWVLIGITSIFLVLAVLKRQLKEDDRMLLAWCGLTALGSIAFWFALAKQFIAHEYYFLDSLYPAFVMLIVAGLKHVKWRGYVSSLFWTGLLSGCLAGAVFQSSRIQQEKYAYTEWDRGEVTRKNFTGAEMLLDQLNVATDAKMLVLEPYSTNAPLILMNRKGYTILRTNRANVERALELPFDYVVCQDIYLTSEVMHQLGWSFAACLDRIGGNGRISVFEFRPERCSDQPTGPQEVLGDLFGAEETAQFAATVGMIDTSAMFNNTEADLTASSDYGVSFQYHLIDTTAYSDLVATVHFDTTRISRSGGHACDIVMSTEGLDGSAIVFESQRIELKDMVGPSKSIFFNIPRGMPQGAILRCYVWNRYRQDIPVTAMEVSLLSRD